MVLILTPTSAVVMLSAVYELAGHMPSAPSTNLGLWLGLGLGLRTPRYHVQQVGVIRVKVKVRTGGCRGHGKDIKGKIGGAGSCLRPWMVTGFPT